MTEIRFRPGLRRARVRPDAVQLGSDPERAMLLQLPDQGFMDLLEHIDHGVDESTYSQQARKLGVPTEGAAELLRMLREAGLVESGTRPWAATPERCAVAQRRRAPGRALESRRRQRVFVDGQGRLARAVVRTLRQAGIGKVWCADDRGRDHATFAVLLNCLPAALTARAYQRRRRPYLAVSNMDGVSFLGPLVRSANDTCVHCVELHHCLPLPTQGPGYLEATLTDLTAAAVASAVVQYAEGEPSLMDSATVVLGAPLTIRRRGWQLHPDCAFHGGETLD